MKQAVAYVLDASPSMLKPYPKDVQNYGSGKKQQPLTSRLDCAKQALELMISELMLQSITNEVCVIVCKTEETKHHIIAENENDNDNDDDDNNKIPFPNLTELTSGVVRPNVDLLRRIWQVQPVSSSEVCQTLQGDIVDGILLAADALYERTNKKKYERHIVILTDVDEQEIVMDAPQTLVVIDSLRSMECQLTVIGLDFDMEAVYEEPAAPPSQRKENVKQEEEVQGETVRNKKIKVEPTDDISTQNQDDNSSGSSTEGGEEGAQSDDDEEEDVEDTIFHYKTKEDREKLLLSLTEKTGGKVIAALTLQQVLDASKGKRLQTATKRKFDFRIAPGLTIPARYILLMRKLTKENLKTEAVVLDDDTGQALRNDRTGKELTDEITSVTQYVDAIHNPDTAVNPEDITTAIRYGSDLIPMSSFDFEGLHSAYQQVQDNDDSTDDNLNSTEPRMEILGYVHRSQVPAVYVQGPPYAISGHDSLKSAAAISALAQALDRSDKAAIVIFFKTKNSFEPILGALFPVKLEDEKCERQQPQHPMHLVFLQLPFAGDVKKLNMAPLDEYLKDPVIDESVNNHTIDEHDVMKQKYQVCDDLIDSLMLPDDAVQSGKVPSPFLRSWNQTKVKRAIDNTADLVFVRRQDDGDYSDTLLNDPMSTPPHILEQAMPSIQKFQEAFPLLPKKTRFTHNQIKGATIKGGRKVLTYKDYLDDE